jgi:hypothetical protein
MSIEIVIDTSGDVQVAVKGEPGKQCTEITKGIESALGLTTAQQKTAEYNQAASTARKATQ